MYIYKPVVCIGWYVAGHLEICHVSFVCDWRFIKVK